MARDFDTAKFDRAVAVELGRIKLDARREVHAAGDDAASYAKSLAPRDSGEMADSIEAKHGFDREGPYSDVVVEPFYSSWIEWGRTGVQARPFIRPAVAAAVRKHLRRRP